jgi:hypothetical protein
MALMRRKAPTDAVAGLDPKFIWQKGQSLASPSGAFRADGYLPFLALSGRCSNTGNKDCRHCEQSHLFHFFVSPCFRNLLV